MRVAFFGFLRRAPQLTNYKKSNILWVAGPGEVDFAESKLLFDLRPQLLVVTASAVKELWERGVPLPPVKIIIRQR